MDDIRAELRRDPHSASGAGGSGATLPPRLLVALAIIAAVGLLTGITRSDADAGRLDHTYASVEDLAEDVLDAVARDDGELLRALPLSEREFRHVVWPELPASRSIPVDYVWAELRQKSDAGLRSLLALHGGRRYQLVGVAYEGERSSHDSFVVHRRTRLDVRDEMGREVRLAILGSVLVRDGHYKLFSYNVSR